MRNRIFTQRLMLAGAVAAQALLASAALAATPVLSANANPDGATFKTDNGLLKLQVFSDRIVRVTYAPGAALPETKSLSVIAPPATAGFAFKEAADGYVLSTSALQAHVDRKTGVVTFADPAGKTFLAEMERDAASMSPSTIPNFKGLQSKQDFALAPDEAIFGLGEHREQNLPPDRAWNYRGQTLHLYQINMDTALPIALSSRGYGVFWDNPAVTDVAVGVPGKENVLSWNSQAAKSIDYYFMAGPNLNDVVAEYRRLTGAAPLFPEWTYGFWQCREHYATQQEILAVIAKYRERGTPIDGIIQDWRYWDPSPWGSHELDPVRYPDPKGMMDTLHKENAHLIISVWARFDNNSIHYQQFDAIHGLLDVSQNIGGGGRRGGATAPAAPIPPGATAPTGTAYKYYDPFNPDALTLYWKQMSESLFKFGVDGWWLDASEPEIRDARAMNGISTGAGPGAYVANAFPLLHTQGVYQNQRAESSAKRVFILTRSAYSGQQRNGAVSWSGDIQGNWQTFQHQVPGGLNFVLSGIPYWNTDIGGFNSYQSPGYAELFTRWFEYGAFCPMFRVHGQTLSNNVRPSPNSPLTGRPDPYKEMWLWDKATDDILVKYDQLHYRLHPYTYSVAWQITSHNDSLMRPLIMDFRTDAQAVKVGDQYMWGRAIMVNPVTQQGATSRKVYLPAGQDWYDFWTGKRFPGGQTIDAAAPLDTMPLFAKAGSIVPMGPIVNYTREKPDAPLEVRIYRGQDGSFTLYADEGDNYNYEKGAYAEIPFTWHEGTGTLEIGARKGSYPGMPANREFHIVVVGENKGAGLPEAKAADGTVAYSGTAVQWKAPG